MREGVPVPNNIWDEESAVRRYLIYLSMLVDVALSDIAMSAVHGNDLAVLIKERMLVEYSSKAIYCNAHPDYSLFFTTINEAESVRDKLHHGGAPASVVANAEQELEQRRTRFKSVAHMHKVSLSKMMRQITRGGDPSRNDEYVWLYAGPSAIMHGDPEGMRSLLPIDEQGNQRASITLETVYLNALMVDAGSNALNFCDIFIERFHPDNEGFKKRLTDLATQFKKLGLKHDKGRDVEIMEQMRADIEGSD